MDRMRRRESQWDHSPAVIVGRVDVEQLAGRTFVALTDEQRDNLPDNCRICMSEHRDYEGREPLFGVKHPDKDWLNVFYVCTRCQTAWWCGWSESVLKHIGWWATTA